MDSPSHDIKIRVVDNGYVLDIQDRTLVFDDMTKLEEWITENLATPEIVDKIVIASKNPKANDQYWGSPAVLNRGVLTDYNSNSLTEEISDKKETPEHESMLRRIANNIKGII